MSETWKKKVNMARFSKTRGYTATAAILLMTALSACAHHGTQGPTQVASGEDGNPVQLPVGDGSFVFTNWNGPPITIYTHLPQQVTAATPVLFVMHGNGRDPDRYRAEWRDLADANEFILVTPGFDDENFPKSVSYNYGGFRDLDGNLRPRDEWTFAAIEPLFREIRRRTGSEVEKFAIYGHSAGGQFTHRYVQLMQEPLVGIAISANAGSYTMPVFDVDYPFGLRGAPIDEEGLKGALAMPLVVLLGTADSDPDHRSLPDQPDAIKQGPHRFARGQKFFTTGKAQAARLNTPFNWNMRFVSGVGHSNGKMAPTAAKILSEYFGHREAPAAGE